VHVGFRPGRVESGPVDNPGMAAVTPVYFLKESWSGGGAGLDSAAWLEWLST
jgi:hypothetical protein